jgi:hypothetical protein
MEMEKTRGHCYVERPEKDRFSFRRRATRAELERLLQPTRYFQHPRDVVRDAILTTAEKRAILSSWASDACAIESTPELRQIPASGRVVKFDEVIDALQELDGKANIGGMEKPQRRRRGPDRGGNPEEGPAGSGYWY